MAKYVKIELPVRQPDPTLHLCDRIIAKHTLDGAGSPLTGVIDMAAFGLLVTDAKTKRSSAEVKNDLAFDKYDAANNKAGLAAGQNRDTKDTIQWYVRQVKDLLLIKHNGTEEALNPYGFNVIITTSGARKNIKIELPIQLKEMIEMGEAIIAHHTFLGVGSPLTVALIDMAAFGTLVTDARTIYDEWEILRGEVQALNNDVINTLGYGAGQTISTIGTIYNEVGKIRTRLVQKHQGREEALSNWGFTVIVSEKQTGKKKGNPDFSITGTITNSETDEPISDALVLVLPPDIFTGTNAQGKYFVPKQAAGTYSMHVHKDGYTDQTVEGIVITEGVTNTLNVQLVPIALTSVVLEGDAAIGSINDVDTSGFTTTPSTTIQVVASLNEVGLSAAPAPGPTMGATVWHVFPGTQNKTYEAFKALVGASETNIYLKVQCTGPIGGHYKITFNNVIVP